MPRIHRLKCAQPFLDDIASGEKTFELRYNDRAYQKGDILFLREDWPSDDYWLPVHWTPTVKLQVTYVLSGKPWLADSYVALGIKDITKQLTTEE